MSELLLELMSEEIPARMQARAAEQLRRLMTEKLNAAGLTYRDSRSYTTPRRLTLVITGLPAKQADVTEEKKGPRVGSPEKALRGFLLANGLLSLGEAERRETAKGEFYFAVRHIPGRASTEVLPELIVEALQALPWPKSMRWAEAYFPWVRPLTHILAIFGGKPLAGALDLGGTVGADAQGQPITRLSFDKKTSGHRFMAPASFAVRNFDQYKERLKAAKVLLDPAERRQVILEQAGSLAEAAGLTVAADPGLVDEVVGLVEWPVMQMGRIDPQFMDLPAEVLTTSMRAHQKYFALKDEAGGLADRFLIAANMETEDGGATIVAGNERVLRARLADAKFFWDQDCKVRLESRVAALGSVVFHAKLGSLADKVARVEALAATIAKHIPSAEEAQVRRAARLAKADLTSGMVGEFPELQGIMGRYYALNDGEDEAVAEAIAEHYGPLGPNDRCPSAPVSIAVALADKLDSLMAFWAIGEKPTGSKDPFALRRAALGVIRLILENKLSLPLRPILDNARELVAEQGREPVVTAAPGWGDIDEDVLSLIQFIADRLKVTLKDKGVRHDLISAVFALGGEDDLLRLLARVEALQGFLASADGTNLLTAYRRAANIVRIESKKDKRDYYTDGAVNSGRFAQDEESALFTALEAAKKGSAQAVAGGDFGAAMAAQARLREPVDSFFDKVTVNAEVRDLRENRLRLLAAIGATLGTVADFSKIEG